MKTLKWVGRTLLLDSFAVKLCLMVTLLFTAIPAVHVAIGTYVKILLLWGGVVLVADVFTRRAALRNRYAGFLALFVLSYVVTIWLNRAAGLGAGLSHLAYIVLFFFVLFAYDPDGSPDRAAWEVRTLARVFIVVTALLALACLATFVFSINYRHVERLESGGYTQTVYGMLFNRLYGLYNPNTGSTLNLLSSAFSLLLMANGVRRAERVMHMINLAVQYVCMVLTLSRTAWYMYAAFVVMFCFFVLPRRSRTASCSRRRELLYAGGAVVAAALVILLATPVKAVMSYVPGAVQSLSAEEEPIPQEESPTATSAESAANTTATDAVSPKETTSTTPTSALPTSAPTSAAKATATAATIPTKQETAAPVELDREEGLPGGGLLSGRQYLWKGGFQAFLEKPLFGTSYEGMTAAILPHIPPLWQQFARGGGLHNIAVTVLVCSGVAGFLPLLLFLLFSGARALKWLWRRRGDRAATLCNGLTILLVTILGVEMLEARLLYVVTIFGALFWMMYGYTMQMVDACEPEKAARGGVYNRVLNRLNKKQRV